MPLRKTGRAPLIWPGNSAGTTQRTTIRTLRIFTANRLRKHCSISASRRRARPLSMRSRPTWRMFAPRCYWAMQRLIHAHQKLGRGAQAARLLISYIDRCASDELIDVAFPFIAEQCGADIIHTLARAQMQKSPTLVSMAHLLNVQRTIADAPMRSELDAMHAMLA